MAFSTRRTEADRRPDPGPDSRTGFGASASNYPGLSLLVGKVPNGLLLILIGATSFGLITVLFVASAMIFYPIGQETGRLFRPFKPLTAYSINVAGALVGSLAFTLIS